MNWLLIIVLGILVVNSLIGMKVGLIKTVFSLCSLVVALVLTVWISPLVNDFMRGNEKFYDGISTKVEKMLPFDEEEVKADAQDSIIEGLKLPQSIKDSLIKNNNADVYKELSISSFKDYVTGYLTGIIINALAFFATFLIILIILWIASIALNIIGSLPLIKQVNKTAGLLAGMVHGLVVVWLFFILITVFGSSEFGQKAMEMIGESQVLSFIYNNNLLLGFITNAAKIFL
ncbi:MAG: CvpA family protein [Mobilitalea sp.]